MNEVTTRNRQIKKVLEVAFGRGKVRVRGSRGTAYGWVDISIDHTPLDIDQSRRLESLAFELIAAAGIRFDSYYSDDNTWNSKVHLNFNACRYAAARRLEDGSWMVKRDYWDHDSWEHLAAI